MTDPDVAVVAGTFLVETLLRHGRAAPAELAVAKGGSARGLARIVHLAERRGVNVRWVSSDEMRTLAGESHDVAALLAERETLAFDVLFPPSPRRALLLALEGIEDPHNLGAILRTAWAAPVDGIVLEGHARALPRDVLARSSAGASECLPIIFPEDFAGTLKRIGETDVVCVAAEAAAERDLFATDLPERLAVVIGGEHRGLSRAALEACALRVSIPMNDAVQSLPATASAAVMLYETVRRRAGRC